MKAFLLYCDRDFELEGPLPHNEAALTQDLELGILFDAMAHGDPFLRDIARRVVLTGVCDLETILHRQAALRDCLQNVAIVRDIYGLVIESIEQRRKSFWSFISRFPGSILYNAVNLLQLSVEFLKRLRRVADEHAGAFQSDAFTALFATLKRELHDEYFATIQDHLRRLKFRDGVLISAGLGNGNKGTDYILCKMPERSWWRRTLAHTGQDWVGRIVDQTGPVYSFSIHPRDEAGGRALAELQNRGLNLVANALAQSTDHILSFFDLLRAELAFYVGCLNLADRLRQKGEPICFPVASAAAARELSCRGLYDVSLGLSVDRRVVGNDVDADGKEAVIITGANRGGKSTFLRSVGQAQLMMQCGMFVPAESFRANLCNALFTHYKREEDPTMKSGKFDEELGRMSEIADALTANSMVLFNESFAATNDREGSEMARQIVGALLEKRIKVFFVTHLYDFAHGLHDSHRSRAAFLRAERRPDGGRTFKLIEGEPLQTSYGVDLYRRIFAAEAVA
jgi:DNA mismatch repair ATPase MutS